MMTLGPLTPPSRCAIARRNHAGLLLPCPRCETYNTSSWIFFPLLADLSFATSPAVLGLDQHGQLSHPHFLRIHGAMRHTRCQRIRPQLPASGHRPKARGSLRWWALHEHHGKSRTNKLHIYLRLYYRTVLPMPPLWRW
jgi:hypothetical protein